MENSRLNHLFQQYMEGSGSEEERLEFFKYANDPKHADHLKVILDHALEKENSELELDELIQERILHQVFKDQEPLKRTFGGAWLKYAAILVVLLSVGLYFFFVPGTKNRFAESPQYMKNNIKPGGNKAILKLDNGREIVLDDAKDGEIAKQAGFSITKTKDGQLVYTAVPNLNNLKATNSINTISTPRGGQYQVSLPDGTHVWLNAASSLKYPAVFVGNQRRVELTGEAYFEVYKDKSRPFFVKTAKQEVEVLGTHFNISSYADENSTKTDLFEGSVRVATLNGNKKDEVILKPAEQAVVKENAIVVYLSNSKESLAWKEGYFQFKDEDIESIMRKVARWYDVEIVYQGKINRQTFKGKVSRYENVAQVLRILELTETIHFKIEGRKVIVLP